MATQRRTKRSANFLIGVSTWLVMCLTALAGAQGQDDGFQPADGAQVKGVTEIVREVREAASAGRVKALRSREWEVVYEGEVPKEMSTTIIVEVTPVEAFQTTRTDARTFSAKLVRPSALVTAMGQLRAIGVRVSRFTGEVPAKGGSGPGEARRGMCTVIVSFRLTGTGQPIDVASLRSEQYKLNYPSDIATLAGIKGKDLFFARSSNAPARVELQLYDPELTGWTSYISDLGPCVS